LTLWDYSTGDVLEEQQQYMQWWAIVFVDDNSPDRFGVTVFEVAWSDHPEDITVGRGRPVDVARYIFTPIPEPATGLLALAGVALLLRRKRK